MMPLNHKLTKFSGGYKLTELQEKINQQMDEIQLFSKKEKGLKTLIQAVRIYNQDRGVEFGIENLLCK